MVDILRNIIRLIWVIIPIPMFWRSIIFVLVLNILLFWLITKALPWLIDLSAILVSKIIVFLSALILLFPDFLITKTRRAKNLQPLWISYFLGNLFDFVSETTYSGIEQFRKMLNPYLHRKWLPHNLHRKWIIFLFFPSLIVLLIWALFPNSPYWWKSFDSWTITGKWQLSPEEFVENYYDYINHGLGEKADNCLSLGFKNNRDNYQNYLHWLNVRKGRIYFKIHLVSNNTHSAIVDVNLRYFVVKKQSLSKPENLRFLLIWDFQNQGWLIDSFSSKL